jgi:hypothetical protein
MSSRDITVGRGFIYYCGGPDGHKWALPGGDTTEDFEEAVRIATIIGEIIDKQEGK